MFDNETRAKKMRKLSILGIINHHPLGSASENILIIVSPEIIISYLVMSQNHFLYFTTKACSPCWASIEPNTSLHTPEAETGSKFSKLFYSQTTANVRLLAGCDWLNYRTFAVVCEHKCLLNARRHLELSDSLKYSELNSSGQWRK